jgi:hypothetical protein
MTQTDALADFRAGGGHIANEYWADIYHLAQETYARGEAVTGLPFETPIPSQAYSVVDVDYGQKYVTVIEATYTDAATGERVTRDITIESDEVRAWGDIEDEALSILETYGAEGGRDGIDIGRSWYYTPKWSTIPFD